MTQLAYAVSSGIFALVFLGGIIGFGPDTARALAISAALLASYSQFIAQDNRALKASTIVGYMAYALSVSSLGCLWFGV